VVEELATDAVSDTIAIKQYKKLPFTKCLQNAFRDCCRQIDRMRKEKTISELEALFEAPNARPTIRIGAKWPSPEIQAQRNEERELFRKELENHGKLSRQVVYMNYKGSSYEEIAEICGKTPGQSRSVFWYNFNQIRDNLRRRHVKEDDV
jgi:DNA-directed RNA polymerase specialized sigma24 family protein